MTASAPKARALNTSVPLLTPPSISTATLSLPLPSPSSHPLTARTTSLSTSMVAAPRPAASPRGC